MEDDKLFKVTGKWSKAWYIKMIKENPERRGYTWIRKEGGIGAPQAEGIKSIFSLLVHQRYIDPIGKPDGHGSTPYKVTSLGHRYLEEHKGTIALYEADQRLKKAMNKASDKIISEHDAALKSKDPLIGKKMPVTDNPEFRATFEEPIESERKKNAGFILKRKGYDGIHGPSEPVGDGDDIEADDAPLGESHLESQWDALDKINKEKADKDARELDEASAQILLRPTPGGRHKIGVKTMAEINPQVSKDIAERNNLVKQLMHDQTTPTLPTAMHVALTDYLMETYGHKVTVVELMKYISNKEAGDGEETW